MIFFSQKKKMHTALELGLRHLNRGAKALIFSSHKYAFGPYGTKNIGQGGTVAVPGEAEIEYEVEVLDILPTFSAKDEDLATRVAEAILKKRHGNVFFHQEDWPRAIRCYQSGVKALEVSEEDHGEEGFKDLVKVFGDISNNMATALFHMKNYKGAKEAAVKVIEVDPNNAKALYRGGMAALMQDNYEEAELALNEALKLAPTDPNIQKGIRELARLKKEYAKKEKAMYQTMAGFLLPKGERGKAKGEEGPTEGTSEDVSPGVTEVQEEEEEEDEGEEEEDKAVSSAEISREGVKETRKKSSGTGWVGFIRKNYEWIVTILFIIIPLIVLWPDLVQKWNKFPKVDGVGSESKNPDL